MTTTFFYRCPDSKPWLPEKQNGERFYAQPVFVPLLAFCIQRSESRELELGKRQTRLAFVFVCATL
jgi:hypothetical protein